MMSFRALYLSAGRMHGVSQRNHDVVPYFLLNQGLSCLSHTNSNYFLNHLYVNKNLWARFFLLHKLDLPYRLSHVVDGAQFSSHNGTWVLQYNLNTMLTDDRVAVHTSIQPSSLSAPSISPIYRSCVWLERELSDFTNINFLGLTDTRRLLLDYFESKQVWQTHVSNDKNFNNALYDIFLAY